MFFLRSKTASTGLTTLALPLEVFSTISYSLFKKSLVDERYGYRENVSRYGPLMNFRLFTFSHFAEIVISRGHPIRSCVRGGARRWAPQVCQAHQSGIVLAPKMPISMGTRYFHHFLAQAIVLVLPLLLSTVTMYFICLSPPSYRCGVSPILLRKVKSARLMIPRQGLCCLLAGCPDLLL